MRRSNLNQSNKKDVISNVIIVVIAFIVVLGLAAFVSKEKRNGNYIREISYSEYKDRINSDDYTIVLFASPTCSHCMAYKPLMNKVLTDYKLMAYYVNVNSTDINGEKYIDIHDHITALKDSFDQDGNPVIPTPTTVIFKSGQEVNSISGNIKDTGFINFLKESGVIK